MKTIIKTSFLLSVFFFGITSTAQEKTSEEKKEEVNTIFKDGANERVENERTKFKKNIKRGRLTKPSIDLSPTDIEARQLIGISTGQENAKTRDTYVFETTITTQIQNLAKRRPKKQSITQSYGNGATMMVMEKGQSIITDLNSETAIILDEKGKTAQVMSMAFMGKMTGNAVNKMADRNNNATPPKITKLARTKNVAGYEAEGYLMESEDGNAEVWYTKEIATSFYENAAGFMAKYITIPANTESMGYPVLITQINKKGKKTTEMRVTNVDSNSKTISLSDFKVMSLFGK